MKSPILVLMLLSGLAWGTVRNVPATYATVQAALSACTPGDTVLVQPGTYNGNIIWPAVNSIKLLSAGDSSNTILSANNTGRVIYVNNAMIDTTTLIKGFTITGGNLTGSTGYGAGINVTSGSVKIEACCIRNNRVYVPGGWGYGGAMHLSNSGTIIVNTMIRNNQIDSATWCYGAGIYITGGTPQLRDVIIHANLAKAEIWCYGPGVYATLTNLRMNRVKVTNQTTGNSPSYFYGTGMYLDDSNVQLVNILVTDNVSGTGGNFNYGGGIYCDGATGVVSMMNVTVANNRKTGNASINGTGLYVRDASVTAVNSIFYDPNTGTEVVGNSNAVINITYSDVRGGYTGIGNINQVPGFVSSTNYHLQTNSPCAGVGTNAGAPVIDLDNQPRPQPVASNTDMGCYEVSQLVGVTEVLSSDLQLYPNPATTMIYLTMNAESRIQLFDLAGRELWVKSFNAGSHTIDVTDLKPGMYILRSSSGEAVRFEKR